MIFARLARPVKKLLGDWANWAKLLGDAYPAFFPLYIIINIMAFGTLCIPYLLKIYNIELLPMYDSDDKIIGYGKYTGPFYSYGQKTMGASSGDFDLTRFLTTDPSCSIDAASMIHDVGMNYHPNFVSYLYYNLWLILEYCMIIYTESNISFLYFCVIFLSMFFLCIPGTVYVYFNHVVENKKFVPTNEEMKLLQQVQDKISVLESKILSDFWGKALTSFFPITNV